MKNLVQSKIDDELQNLLDEFRKKHHWNTSQAIREILAEFFGYELSDNAG